MTNVRESDTSLWLHNKLGNSNDLWSCGSICSQLNVEVLKNIRECFADLQSLVKLKLLISFLHIPRRNVEEWKQELKDIIEIGVADGDQWVSTVAELLKFFPDNGTINFSCDENGPVFTDLVYELKKIIKRHGDTGILPLECIYLNKNSLSAQIGQLPQPVKHFTLKRKPKSAALRAELLQKSNDAANNARKGTTNPIIPYRSRGVTKDLNDNTPLKGIPSRVSFSSGFKTPSALNKSAGSGRNPTRPSMPGVRRDGGIKLLDINEQPIGRDAKRKKRGHEEADAAAKQKEAEKVTEQKHNPTPDYAAGLTSIVPPSPAPTYSLTQTSTPSTQTIISPVFQNNQELDVLEEQIDMSVVETTTANELSIENSPGATEQTYTQEAIENQICFSL